MGSEKWEISCQSQKEPRCKQLKKGCGEGIRTLFDL